MRLPRMTTRRWMIVIGVAALNLAAAHLLLAYDLGLLLGVALNALVLQVALYRLTRSREIERAFFAGFIAAGILSGGHFVWMWTDSHSLLQLGGNGPLVSPTQSQTGSRLKSQGPLRQAPLPPYYPPTTSPSFWCRLLEACEALLEWPYDRLEGLPYVSDLFDEDEAAVFWIAFTLLEFLPQIVVALGGGLLGSFIGWVIRRARRERIG